LSNRNNSRFVVAMFTRNFDDGGNFYFQRQGGAPMPRGMRSTFSREFAAYSVMMMPGNERPDVNAGGKIIMPPSSLETLSRLNISYPMLFKLENGGKERQTHAGVLEFIAEEGKVYLPGWMMRNLLLNEGDRIAITYASLPVASYSKFKPQSCDFLEISNPKAVLEKHLRSFACLSKGDIISIDYIGREFEVQIVETKPEDAVNIIECDMNVDFEAPVGYKEPERVQPPEETPGSFGTPDIQKKLVDYYEKQTNFHSFQGKGGRIDGKKKGTKGVKKTIDLDQIYKRGVPNYDWDGRTLHYIHSKPKTKTEEEAGPSFTSFTGSGQALRTKKTKRSSAS